MKERREAGTATARLNFTCKNIFPHAALSVFISFLYAVAEIHFFNYTFHNKYFISALFKIKEALPHANTKEKAPPVFSAFLVGLALTGGTVLAHTMPFSETTLILEKGHGLHAEIRPAAILCPKCGISWEMFIRKTLRISDRFAASYGTTTAQNFLPLHSHQIHPLLKSCPSTDIHWQEYPFIPLRLCNKHVL